MEESTSINDTFHPTMNAPCQLQFRRWINDITLSSTEHSLIRSLKHFGMCYPWDSVSAVTGTNKSYTFHFPQSFLKSLISQIIRMMEFIKSSGNDTVHSLVKICMTRCRTLFLLNSAYKSEDIIVCSFRSMSVRSVQSFR
ncbi:hypothetical protein AB6A40_003155 [Gnathostoma spinigerum]|uniref:Uncharacterized protein n=1 Tax=Gnathostoma spinigerum TaxID=75299 RepID=A0ABD6EA01_9BILA